MNVEDTEKHERAIFVRIDREELEGLIRNAVAEKLGVTIDTLRQHGKVEIKENMVGSPEYRSGYFAVVRATIPLGVKEA